jgi:hypothetical protein
MQHINRSKDKNHMILSTDKKSLWQNPTPFHGRSSEETGMQGMFLNIIKAIYHKPKANISLNAKQLKPFPLKSGTIQDFEC